MWWFTNSPSRLRQPVETAHIQEWEHGYKTDRVIATRYTNPDIGYNIGFQFPKNVADADRVEVSQFFEVHNGWLFQGGGYPGAIAYVKFQDVTDNASANAKLKEILPDLDQLMSDMSNDKPIHIDTPKPKYTWPDTDAPDKSDKDWVNSNLNVNGTQYIKKEVSAGHWQWVVDEKAMKSLAEFENHRRQLWDALTTRVLTAAEMKEVAQFGSTINIEPMVSYSEQEKANELRAALITQEALRHEAAGSRHGL